MDRSHTVSLRELLELHRFDLVDASMGTELGRQVSQHRVSR